MNIAGVYTLSLAADDACSDLTAVARTRTYKATMVAGYRSTTFVGTLGDARIVVLPFSPYFETQMAGDFANTYVRFIEQLGDGTYLAIEGNAAASFGPTGITAPFSGYFVHCPGQPVWSSGEYWWCGAGIEGAQCQSTDNRLTLFRR